jgi:hypothetical protein
MALTRTLAELRTAAKARCDMENSSFVADSEWLRFINLGYAELYDKLVRARGFDYYGKTGTVNTVAGTATVALPSSDFYKLWGVSASINGTDVPLRRMGIAQRDDLSSATSATWSSYSPPWYMIRGANMLFRPVPTAIYTITFWYVPHITALSSDSDTVDGINGWEEYIEISAAIQAVIKEEGDPAALLYERARMDARIEVMASDRDEGTPIKVQDVRPRRRFLVDR